MKRATGLFAVGMAGASLLAGGCKAESQPHTPPATASTHKAPAHAAPAQHCKAEAGSSEADLARAGLPFEKLARRLGTTAADVRGGQLGVVDCKPGFTRHEITAFPVVDATMTSDGPLSSHCVVFGEAPPPAPSSKVSAAAGGLTRALAVCPTIG